MGKHCSSSSSGHSKNGKKKKDGKKKNDKKDKKTKKDDPKNQKRAERAELWNCERGDAARAVIGLLQLDASIEDDLHVVFKSIDEGETVRLDGLQNKQARKKLRHLLQAFRLIQVDGGQAYRSAELKVSFAALFQSCLLRAREHMPEAKEADPEPAPPAKPVCAVKIEADPRSGYAGEEEDEGEIPVPRSPPKPCVKGPQLPGASVGAVGGDDGSESDPDAGPRTDGAERKGINLDDLEEIRSAREDWMTMAPEAMAGLFSDGAAGKKGDRFEVGRSKEEREAFEKAFKERGPSLLSQQKEGAFSDFKEEQDTVRKRKVSASEGWGMSSQEQERAANNAKRSIQKTFDPEKDLTVRKPMTSDEFSKLVENSQEGLAGRFSRGGVASSFL